MDGANPPSGFDRHLQALQRLVLAQHGAGAAPGDLAEAVAMLGRLGGGGGGEGPAGRVSRVRQQASSILKRISNEGDDSEQYSGLMELCNTLNMATEEVLTALRPDSFVPPLVSCLQKEYNPELMLLAARCLTYMVDAIPVTVIALANSDNGVNTLLDRLRVIVDIELAEQCLTCVDKIAQDAPNVLLQLDGPSAVLAFVDFFSLSVQRKAWGTVAALCKRMKSEHYKTLRPVLPNIRAALVHDDPKIAEHAVHALQRILQAVHRDTQKVNEVLSDACVALGEILSRASGDAVFRGALQLVVLGVAASPTIAATLIEIGLVEHLLALMHSDSAVNPAAGDSPLQLPAAFPSSTATPPSSSVGRKTDSPQSNAVVDFGTGTLGSDEGTTLGGSWPVVSPQSIPLPPPAAATTAVGTSGSPMATTTTPSRASAGGGGGSDLAGSSSRRKPLPPDVFKEACTILASLVPRIREGYMPYINVLWSLQNSGQLAPQQGTAATAHSDESNSRSDPSTPLMPGSTSGGGDEEDGEEDNGEEDDTAALHAEMEELVVEGVLQLRSEPARHTNSRNAHNSCDGCGQPRLLQGNWFRCNKCPDFDFCMRCFVNDGGRHGTSAASPTAGDAGATRTASGSATAGPQATGASRSRAPHSFTDMAEVVLSTEASAAAARTLAEIRASTRSSPTSDGRAASFAEAPYLFQRVLEAVPTVTRLKLNSEHPRIEFYSMLFLSRVVTYASPQDLRRVLVDAPLCEAIATALAERDSVAQLTALYLATVLIHKLPDVYTTLFVREGVTSALLNIKSLANQRQASSPPSSPTTPKSSKLLEPLSEDQMLSLCSTAAGWKTLLAHEAGLLLEEFPELSCSKNSAVWSTICNLLDESKEHEAFSLLNDQLPTTSVFELLNSGVFHHLRTAFQRSPKPVAAVVDFVYTLSSQHLAAMGNHEPSTESFHATERDGLLNGDGGGVAASATASGSAAVSNLTKFVRLLQSSLSQLEDFKLPKSVNHIQTPNTQIRLNIVPHNPEQYAQELAKRQAKQLGMHRSSSSGSPPQSPVVPRPASAAASSSTVTPLTEGRAAQVTIEPFASIAGVAEFVRTNLLPNAQRPPSSSAARERRQENDGEDDVEEILPDSSSASGGSPKLRSSASRRGGSGGTAGSSVTGAPPSASAPRQPIYIRVGHYEVPTSMTMLQVIQRFVKKSRTANASTQPLRVDPRHRHLPPEIRALLQGSGIDPITVHYSTVPFGSDVLTPELHVAKPTGNPGETVHFLPVGDSVVTEGCTNIRNSIFAKFEFSQPFLSPAIQDILSLLGVLYNAVVFWDCIQLWLQSVGLPSPPATPTINVAEFISIKLTNKAMRHSSNMMLAGQHLGMWAVNVAMDCNFLFTPSARRFMFDVSFFGTARSLVRIQEYLTESGAAAGSDSGAGTDGRRHRLQRSKKRVWRERALDCAMAVMDGHPGSGSVVLEFEFYGEEGSGLGPTLEFYTLVGDQLRERRFQLWRPTDEDHCDKYYAPKNGLFPRPIPQDHPDAGRMRRYFRFLGRYLARALLDKRIPNLRLSRPLVKLIRGDVVSFDQLRNINDDMFNVLRQLIHKPCDEGCAQALPVVEAKDLGLTFVLPGEDDVELIENGAHVAVDSSNALRYLNLVAEFLLKTGIEHLIVELRAGFHELVPLYALRILTVEELQSMMDGHTAPVTLQDLEMYCTADHGFTLSSQPVRWLFEVIDEMPIDMQRRFFQFLTGSPYLPVGGLACLKPRLTVVRKVAQDTKVAETAQLPSVMTCQNYLKLPQYESKEQLRHKLLQAVEEGCGIFLFT